MDSTSQINITQTKFYSPALNAAIFDGPIKIYFSQAQENAALKLYFELNKKIVNLDMDKGYESLQQVYVIIYPSSETFYNSFDKTIGTNGSESLLVAEEQWQDHHIIGIRGPIENEDLNEVYDKLRGILGASNLSFQEEELEAFV